MSTCVGKSPLLNKYENHDIILSEEDNMCKDLVENVLNIFEDVSHDAVIVGWGRQGFYEYWLVK